MSNTQKEANQFLENVFSVVREKLQSVGVSDPSPDLVKRTAKEVGYVQTKLGKSGGTFVTLRGLEVCGHDTTAYAQACDRDLHNRSSRKRTETAETAETATVTSAD